MEANISQTIKSCHYQLRNIGAIRHLLPTNAAHALVRSLVLSRLDYCNSLLVNIPNEQLQRLQRVENTAARIVMRCKKSSHITPTLIQLHWLPVHARIKYKILSLAYQCYHHSAPAYLSELTKHYKPPRQLRSADLCLLSVPKPKLRWFWNRSFSFNAATLWNELPTGMKKIVNLSTFKRTLKTYLFTNSYNTAWLCLLLKTLYIPHDVC